MVSGAIADHAVDAVDTVDVVVGRPRMAHHGRGSWRVAIDCVGTDVCGSHRGSAAGIAARLSGTDHRRR